MTLKLKTISTRGDGKVGENVTHHVNGIKGIPKRLPTFTMLDENKIIDLLNKLRIKYKGNRGKLRDIRILRKALTKDKNKIYLNSKPWNEKYIPWMTYTLGEENKIFLCIGVSNIRTVIAMEVPNKVLSEEYCILNCINNGIELERLDKFPKIKKEN